MNSIVNMDSNNIQAELNRLSESNPAETQVKAALFNLIVYTHDLYRASYFKKIVETIIQQFPCRLIFIQTDIINQTSSINVQVSLCNSTTAKKVNSDQVFIEASGNEIERIPFLILPHLISDLPIYLLWGQDPFTDKTILPKIQPLATRIIFDSESTENLQEFARTLLTLIKNSSIEIVDMNWIGISGWTKIVARAFDTQTRIELIKKTSYMRLVYNDLEDPSFTHPQTQAIYLQAWIASCLEWTFDKIEVNDQNHTTIYYRGVQGAIKVDLIPETRADLAPKEIIEWELCDSKNYDCLFSRQTMNQVVVKASNQYQCLLPFSFLLPTLQSGRSLMQETFYQKISEQYPALLHLISQIKWD